MSEIAIRGGTVVDGTGAKGYEADVLVRDGRIAGIGSGLSAERELDASGCVVAPGFIDIHTHYDAQVFWDPALTPSCFHGVTTVVAGNCGFTIAPTREPTARSDRAGAREGRGHESGVARWRAFPGTSRPSRSTSRRSSAAARCSTTRAYVGHTALRLFHMGDDAYEREATDAEVAAMCQPRCARRWRRAPSASRRASRRPTSAWAASRSAVASGGLLGVRGDGDVSSRSSAAV